MTTSTAVGTVLKEVNIPAVHGGGEKKIYNNTLFG
jgi:hypothetical protein